MLYILGAINLIVLTYLIRKIYLTSKLVNKLADAVIAIDEHIESVDEVTDMLRLEQGKVITQVDQSLRLITNTLNMLNKSRDPSRVVVRPANKYLN